MEDELRVFLNAFLFWWWGGDFRQTVMGKCTHCFGGPRTRTAVACARARTFTAGYGSQYGTHTQIPGEVTMTRKAASLGEYDSFRKCCKRLNRKQFYAFFTFNFIIFSKAHPISHSTRYYGFIVQTFGTFSQSVT